MPDCYLQHYASARIEIAAYENDTVQLGDFERVKWSNSYKIFN